MVLRFAETVRMHYFLVVLPFGSGNRQLAPARRHQSGRLPRSGSWGTKYLTALVSTLVQRSFYVYLVCLSRDENLQASLRNEEKSYVIDNDTTRHWDADDGRTQRKQ